MRQKILLLGPAIDAVSGVSTHLNQLFNSELRVRFELLHFQVGSEGRKENSFQKLFRLTFSPLVFFAFLMRHRPPIVHLNTSMDPKGFWRDTVYLLIARIFNGKVVYQVHGGALPEDFSAGHKLLTSCLRWVLKRPDVVVVLGQLQLNAYRHFLPGQRLEVIPNAIDASALASEALNAKKLGPLHLVYLGRFTKSKGVFEILEALDLMIKQGRNLRLSLGGAGPDEVLLRTRVRELRLDDKVDFTGPLFGNNKDRLWRSGHVFVFPTYHQEGLPYSLLEAMAAGAVPITTKVAGIPDVMQGEIHGIFVDAKDSADLACAIARLDNDRALLSRMALAGRKRVLEHYTISRLTNDFAGLYESLIEKNDHL